MTEHKSLPGWLGVLSIGAWFVLGVSAYFTAKDMLRGGSWDWDALVLIVVSAAVIVYAWLYEQRGSRSE